MQQGADHAAEHRSSERLHHFCPRCSLLGLLYRADFRGEHVRVLGSGVTALSENDSVRESCFSELAQEGNSFLRTGNSRKPIRFTGAGFWLQRTRKHYDTIAEISESLQVVSFTHSRIVS
jgi:hypothetical protein